MIAAVSPNVLSCEHSLNSLRYADRVKELASESVDGQAAHDDWAQAQANASPPQPQKRRAAQPKQAPAPAHQQSERAVQKPKPAPAKKEFVVAPIQAIQDEENDEMRISHENLIETIINENDDIVAAHRQQVQDIMDLVKEEMHILSRVEQPGGSIDTYISSLDGILDRKMGIITQLRQRVHKFQAQLKEEEDFSKSMERGASVAR